MKKTAILLVSLLVICFTALSQQGKLFIIGGGDRSVELMRTIIQEAKISPADYIVILPMSSAEPDTSFLYIRNDFRLVCNNSILNLNFTKENIDNSNWLDTLRHAKLIFITGGDQVRFMKVVLHTPVYTAIHDAFAHGATIAGTSAGAAVMSKKMITGNQVPADTPYHETFRKLRSGNLEIAEGLGLVDSVIVDQHFIVRSRYNRLLTALADYPAYMGIGIDEETAVIVSGKHFNVVGAGQVVVLSNPKGIRKTTAGLIKFSDIRFSIYTAGDEFDRMNLKRGAKK
jgi:cyanophycinase